MRIAENVSVTQSDIDAWAIPWALKTGTVDLLYKALEKITLSYNYVAKNLEQINT